MPSRLVHVPGVAENRGHVAVLVSSGFSSSRAGRGEAVSHVIADSQNSDSDDDGQFVVEAAPPPSEMAGLEVVSSPGWAVLSLHLNKLRRSGVRGQDFPLTSLSFLPSLISSFL